MVADYIRKYMAEVSFLPRKSYALRPRYQYKIEGEVSAIGSFDPQDRQDMLSFVRSANRKGLSEEYFLSGKEAIEWASDPITNKKGNRHVLFSIRGSKQVSAEEVGEVQGYIYFSSDRVVSSIASQMKKFKVYKMLSPATRFFEISYAKKPGAAPHQVSSAVRQALYMLLQTDAAKRKNQSQNRIFPQVEVVGALDMSINRDSRYVLEASAFERVGQIEYEGEGTHVSFRVNWEKLFQLLSRNKREDAVKDFVVRRGTRYTIETKINPLTYDLST